MVEHRGYDEDGRPSFVSENDGPCTDILFGESPTARIWSHMFCWKTLSLGAISHIAEGASISRTSLYKVWHNFINNEWIIPDKKYKGCQYYKVNMKHPIVIQMFKLQNVFLADHLNMTIAEYDASKERYKIQRKKKKDASKKNKRGRGSSKLNPDKKPDDRSSRSTNKVQNNKTPNGKKNTKRNTKTPKFPRRKITNN